MMAKPVPRPRMLIRQVHQWTTSLESKLLSIQMTKVEAIGLIITHFDIYFCFVCIKGYIYLQSTSICAQYQVAVAASLICLGLVLTATSINGIGRIHYHHSLRTPFRSWTRRQTDSTGIEIPGPWIQRVGGESRASQPRSKTGICTGCKSCNDCLGTRLRPLASMTQSSPKSSHMLSVDSLPCMHISISAVMLRATPPSPY